MFFLELNSIQVRSRWNWSFALFLPLKSFIKEKEQEQEYQKKKKKIYLNNSQKEVMTLIHKRIFFIHPIIPQFALLSSVSVIYIYGTLENIIEDRCDGVKVLLYTPQRLKTIL